MAVLLSLALLLIDQRTGWLSPIRYGMSYVTGGVHVASHVPSNVYSWVSEQWQSHGDLLKRNRILERQNFILQQKAQQLAVLRAENARLSELLNSSAKVAASVSVAEVIGISSDPNRQELVINRGQQDGVFRGQVVLDAYGVMGQVASVGPYSSHVLLITDASHALSVQDNRNGLRGILAGTGRAGQMQWLYVPASADVKEGDLLVSTGLEGRFPRGYPVATVTSVTRQQGTAFLNIVAKPKAHIRRVSHVLLVTRHHALDSQAGATGGTNE